MGYGDHMGWMGLWWAFGAVLLVLVVWIMARTAAPRGRDERDDTPEGILKQRYARGDIDHDEYVSRLHDLRR